MQQNHNSLEVIVNQHFDLPSFHLFPPNLLSLKTLPNSTTPLYEKAFNEFPSDDLEHGFDMDDNDGEPDDQYYEALGKYKMGRINFLMHQLGVLQFYKNQLLNKSDTMQSTNPEVGSLNYDILQSVNGPILSRLTTVEDRIANLINGYIAQAFGEGDGSETVKLTDQVKTIKTDLSHQNFTKISTFLSMIGKSKKILIPLMKKEAKSKLPNMSEHTSSLSAYCTECDSKRKELEMAYSEMPKSRNIVQARCELTDNLSDYNSYFKQAMLKGDMYMTMAGKELSVSFGEHAGTNNGSKYMQIDYLQAACIDPSNRLLIVSDGKGVIRNYKIFEGESLKNFFKLESEFQTPYKSIDYQIFEKGRLFCLDSKQSKINIGNPETKEFSQVDCKASQSFYPTKLSYNEYNEKLYTHCNAILHETDVNSARSNYLVGAGHRFSDLDFERNLILAGSYDGDVHLFDTRLQFTPILRLSGHGDFVQAVTWANVEGNLFAFSGGKDECIRCWDLRMHLPLYELSTGNNKVKELHWHNASSSLLACTNYLPDGPDITSNNVTWQKGAHHTATHFKKHFSLDVSAVLKYNFKDTIVSSTRSM